MKPYLLRGRKIPISIILFTFIFLTTTTVFSQTTTTTVACGQTITYPNDGCGTDLCTNQVTITGGGSQSFDTDGNYLCSIDSDIGSLDFKGTNNNQVRLCGNNHVTGIGTNFGQFNSFVNTKGSVFHLDYTGFGHTNHLTITNYGILYLEGSDNYDATTIYNVGSSAVVYTSGDFIVNGDDSIYLMGGILNVNGKFSLNNSSALFCMSDNAFINTVDVEVNSANEIHVDPGSRSCLRYTGSANVNSDITPDTLNVCMGSSATPIPGFQSWGPQVNVATGCNSCPSLNPLPVKLKSFEVKQINNIPVLKWTTASEINTSIFEIERSRTGNIFDKIASLQANGNSDEEIDYTYTDKQPFDGANYYRLKMVDRDGAYAYSAIKLLRLNTSTNTLRLISVRSDALQIGLPPVADNGRVKLIDAMGRLLWQQQVYASQYLLNISIPGIASGNYFLQYSDSKKQQTVQVFVPK